MNIRALINNPQAVSRQVYSDRLGWLRFDGQTLQQVHAFCMEALPD